MSKADVRNAHVRAESSKVDVAADDAERLINDPAFTRAFDTIRDALIAELEQIKHDGSEQIDDHEREVCRTLRTLHCVKRSLSLTIQGRQLRQAGFVQHRQTEDK